RPMKLRRTALLTSLTAIGALGSIGVAPAAATPVWNLDIHHNETNFAPGATPEYWFDVDNVGDAASSGPLTLTVELPAGLSRNSVHSDQIVTGGGKVIWSCPGSPGDTALTCTTTTPISRHELSRNLILGVDVAPGAGPDLITTATLSGGGAPEAPPAAGCPPGAGACASELTHVNPDPAPFGILDESWVADFFQADGVTPVRRSGAHPDLATFSFDLNSVAQGVTGEGDPQKAASGNIRHATADLPPGFLGNPTAVGECTPAELVVSLCPASSIVGRADLELFPPTNAADRFNVSSHVYNMSHPLGVITDFAFVIDGNPIHIKVSLDAADNYSVRSTASDINETVPDFNTKVTIWGIPADPSHDSERCANGSTSIDTSTACSTDHPVQPFLTVPFDCHVDNQMKLSRYDSWQETGVFGPDVTYDMPGRMTDCDKPRFEPEVSLEPTGKQANTPTGLDVNIHVPQNENPNGLGTPPVKSAVATFPEGMAFSPSFADGLAGCSLAQIGLGTNEPVACPDNSRIGEVSISTPVLPKPLEGSLYLAKQGDNPFGSLIAFYFAVHDVEGRGVLVKVPGKVDLNPLTGQITASFEDLPQFPFEDFTLKFRSGARAPLTNPPTCGSHEITLTQTSWAQPDVPVVSTNTYQVTEGPGGGPCQNVASQRPFEPQFLGGTLNPLAGAFSPLGIRISRSDADQELSYAEGIAPPGLTASIRGVSRCSEAQIAAATARNQPGQGAQELASPSCPANSQLGSVDVGVGAGPASGLIYVPGKIYLAGPYEGAPLSGVVITPAIAGPLDIGNVVVRAPAYIDPVTAEIRVATDKLPQIVHGVLVRVRDVRVHLDRPNFALNPTGCEQKTLGASMFSTEGAVKHANNRFQVGDCGALGFKPGLSLTLKGGTRRGGHPGLRALYKPRPGDANVKGLVVRLPRSAFLDQAHIRTICTRVQFAANNCPAGAQYGFVKAWTPLLDNPLEGPVYLRSSDHKLPDLVFDLHGEVPFQVATRIDSAHGGIRASIESAPDVPLTKVDLRMQGGKKGLIVNSRNLCSAPSRADVGFAGHNGKTEDLKPLMRAQCGGKGRHK
ncbi:MAG TPA: hypothetical protein VLK56_09230, partial [Solirubrobacterales bacterium]|nr:hypothetical protein [Solirubrobacterales bacterium]